LVKVPPVDPAEVLKALPEKMTSPVILGGLMLGDLARLAADIVKRPNVYVEISWLETMDCMAAALKALDASRLLFATHLPFFYAECALAKIKEARLPRAVEAAILAGNAHRVFLARPSQPEGR
jgi:predicted TIM-barrel fold metal-dependent hydrolase